MTTTLIRRTQGLWIVLVLVLFAGAIGTSIAAVTPSAHVSGLTAKQKKAKAKELKKCKKQKKAKKRAACIKRVKVKYAKLARKKPPVPNGKIWAVDVMDSSYSPGTLTIKSYDWIDWNWQSSTVREGHNVNLQSGPTGILPTDFQSPGVVTGPGGRFKRQFIKPGTYNLYCNLHIGMTMTVTVEK